MNLYKEVEDYSNYIIFKTGTIWSKYKNRFIKRFNSKKRESDGRIVKQVYLYKNGKKKTFLLHRLLGFAFIYNDDPINKIQIDHIDRNPLNNDLSNLRWVTLEEQSRNRKIHNNNKLGLRHIYKRKNRNLFIVEIPRLNYNKSFKTKEEALLQRNMFLESIGEDYENIDV